MNRTIDILIILCVLVALFGSRVAEQVTPGPLDQVEVIWRTEICAAYAEATTREWTSVKEYDTWMGEQWKAARLKAAAPLGHGEQAAYDADGNWRPEVAKEFWRRIAEDID